MKLNQLLNKCASYFSKKNNDIFSHSYKSQKEYLDHFKIPKDDIERSYYQYRCQMYLYPLYMRILFNIASFPIFLMHVTTKKQRLERSNLNKGTVAFIDDGLPHNIIPNSILEKYKNIVYIVEKKEYFSLEDWAFIKTIIRRYPFAWLFLLKCIIKIKMYSNIIKDVSPEVIITCNEYSYTSSILTCYCEKQGVKHFNVMHGEKLFFIRDSFFRYHKCFVWDKYYKELFCELRAYDDQFEIEIPTSLKFKHYTDHNKSFDYTFYLAAETGERLEIIAEQLNKLKSNGYRIAVRPHPRYSNIEEVNRTMHEFFVESISDIKIEESLLNTHNAISGYSTVLNQAYNNGIGVILDDISDAEAFQKLKEYKYIMLNVQHSCLSSIVKNKRDCEGV